MQLRHNTLLFDASVNYIYFKQLEEAGIIVVNKIDLIDEGQLTDLRRVMQQKYPDKIILYQDSFAEGGVGAWMKALACPAALSSLEIDYAIYGAGEALLAWLDQELVVISPDGRAVFAAIALTRRIDERIRECGYPIGHLKFLLDGKTKISYTALAAEEAGGVAVGAAAGSATLLINARVQTAPDVLSRLVTEVVGEVEIGYGCKILIKKTASFQPGFPKPTHRR
jgi:hypothetical protein